MLFSKSQRTAFSYSCQKRGEHIVRGRAIHREVCIVKGGVMFLRGESCHIHTHIPLDILLNFGLPSLLVIYLQSSIFFINSYVCVFWLYLLKPVILWFIFIYLRCFSVYCVWDICTHITFVSFQGCFHALVGFYGLYLCLVALYLLFCLALLQVLSLLCLVGSCSQMHTCCVHWLSVGHANDTLHLSLSACMSRCSFLMRMSIVITILQ